MTSLKLFYQRGASAALLLGLIVGAPDIAQAVQLRGGFYPAIRPSAPYIPPSAPYIPPPSSSRTPALTPGTQFPAVALPHPVPVFLPHAQPPSQGKPGPDDPDGGTGPATKGIGDGGADKGAAGIDLTHAGDDGDTGGNLIRTNPAY
jgi:hypothetical protein